MLPLLSGSAAQAVQPLYVEDVYSAFIWTGTGVSQVIETGIDLSVGDGWVDLKSRSDATDWAVYDTQRGATKDLAFNLTSAETSQAQGLSSFGNGTIQVGTLAKLNTSAATYIGHAWKKAAKFVDVKLYTGTGAVKTVAHDLGCAVGEIHIKAINATTNWVIYHRGVGSGSKGVFGTGAFSASSTTWNNTDPTDSVFTIGTDTDVNANGQPYLALIYAHDDSADGIIQCGTFTTDGSGAATVTLGWEPQYSEYKRSNGSGAWYVHENLRGLSLAITNPAVALNAATAESSRESFVPTATGFKVSGFTAGAPFIYRVVRKGLMRVPTDATKVYDPIAFTGTGATLTVTSSNIKSGPDLAQIKQRSAVRTHIWQDRTRGVASQISPDSAAAQTTLSNNITAFNKNSIVLSTNSNVNVSAGTYILELFKQARGFLDLTMYQGGGGAHAEAHSLNEIPQLIFVKNISTAVRDWAVYFGDPTDFMMLNSNAATADDDTYWNDTAPTKTHFTVGTNNEVNSTDTYFALLACSCPGVSKIGTYNGTGTTQQINCGFASGARKLLIKRIDSTGDWYYWDSTRGIVSGNDPYLLLNSTAAEVTGTDYVDPYSAGFELSSTAPAALNASGGTFLYWAIA